jgi:carbamate kinase
MRRVRVVVALGGNALLRRGEPAEAENQRSNILAAAAALSAAAAEHELVITHGNGPQVGLLALEAEAYHEVKPYPLDVLVAETQGMIGYLLTQALQNELPDRDVVTLETQVLVAADDPAFDEPSKPIGPVYDEPEARRLAAERGWTVAPDGGAYRRVVPSPHPLGIVELTAIELLIERGAVVICAGGGGVPVVSTAAGLRGVEAVVDKDLTAAVLAEEVEADRLVLATDVPFVERAFGTPYAMGIPLATPHDLRGERFAAGSMGPKVEAACTFVERTGGEAVIGLLSEISALAEGTAGTLIVPQREHPSRSARIQGVVR